MRPIICDVNSTKIEPELDGGTYKVAARWRTIQFELFRRKAGDGGARRGAGAFRLTFRRPVRGPIALGWPGHFGM